MIEKHYFATGQLSCSFTHLLFIFILNHARKKKKKLNSTSKTTTVVVVVVVVVFLIFESGRMNILLIERWRERMIIFRFSDERKWFDFQPWCTRGGEREWRNPDLSKSVLSIRNVTGENCRRMGKKSYKRKSLVIAGFFFCIFFTFTSSKIDWENFFIRSDSLRYNLELIYPGFSRGLFFFCKLDFTIFCSMSSVLYSSQFPIAFIPSPSFLYPLFSLSLSRFFFSLSSLSPPLSLFLLLSIFDIPLHHFHNVNLCYRYIIFFFGRKLYPHLYSSGENQFDCTISIISFDDNDLFINIRYLPSSFYTSHSLWSMYYRYWRYVRDFSFGMYRELFFLSIPFVVSTWNDFYLHALIFPLLRSSAYGNGVDSYTLMIFKTVEGHA